MVVRSLWAELGEVCVAGLMVGWVVDRLVVCKPVSWEVVVKVDMKWFLFWFVKGAGNGAEDSLSPLIRPSPWRIRPSICPIRPCPYPIRPFLGFVASGRARWL
jgi:hypothetical protein